MSEQEYYTGLLDRVRAGEITSGQQMADEVITSGHATEEQRGNLTAFCARLVERVTAKPKSAIIGLENV